MKGTYCLILMLHKDKQIRIGKLGRIQFTKGIYIYVGSALVNMEKRLERHRRQEKKMHWHIDYFLRYASITDIVKIESQDKLECSIARLISLLPFSRPISHFGCSDCSCQTHLFYLSSSTTISNAPASSPEIFFPSIRQHESVMKCMINP